MTLSYEIDLPFVSFISFGKKILVDYLFDDLGNPTVSRFTEYAINKFGEMEISNYCLTIRQVEEIENFILHYKGDDGIDKVSLYIDQSLFEDKKFVSLEEIDFEPLASNEPLDDYLNYIHAHTDEELDFNAEIGAFPEYA